MIKIFFIFSALVSNLAFSQIAKPIQKSKSDLRDIKEVTLAVIPPAQLHTPLPKQDPITKLYGYMNSSGEWAIEPSFESAGLFDNNLAFVENKNGSGGLIDVSGVIVTPNVTVYDSKLDFSPLRKADQAFRKYQGLYNI